MNSLVTSSILCAVIMNAYCDTTAVVMETMSITPSASMMMMTTDEAVNMTHTMNGTGMTHVVQPSASMNHTMTYETAASSMGR